MSAWILIIRIHLQSFAVTYNIAQAVMLSRRQGRGKSAWPEGWALRAGALSREGEGDGGGRSEDLQLR